MQNPDFCENLSLICLEVTSSFQLFLSGLLMFVWLELALGDTCITCLYVLVLLRPLNVALDDGKH